MEDGKSPSLPSASWGASGLIQSVSQGLRTKGVDGVNLSLRDFYINTEDVYIFKKLDDIHSDWGGKSTKSINLNANLTWKHPHRYTQKYCLIWAPHGQ